MIKKDNKLLVDIYIENIINCNSILESNDLDKIKNNTINNLGELIRLTNDEVIKDLATRLGKAIYASYNSNEENTTLKHYADIVSKP